MYMVRGGEVIGDGGDGAIEGSTAVRLEVV